VSGRLRHAWLDKPIADANISMAWRRMSARLLNLLRQTAPASTIFTDLILRASNILVYAADKNDVGRGLILLDSLFNDPALSILTRHINLRQQPRIPPILSMFQSIQVADNNEISDYKNEAGRKYNIMKKYHITDTID